MRWTPGGVSGDIEDRRSEGGGGGFGFGGMHLGIGGTIVLLILSVLFRTNLFQFFSPSSGPATTQSDPSRDRAEQPEVEFVSFVLDDAQKTWGTLLPQQANTNYRRSKLVLYRGLTQSGCGTAQSETGPFYCPGDEKLYIDLDFFDELARRFKAPGQFAQAYVIAHELGHHVQDLLGIERKVRRAMQENPREQNELSVRLELQADCFAGVWGNNTEKRNLLEPGDIESGLAAAAAVGDDRLQRASGRAVSPESFTHGSSAQRQTWLKRGLESGNIEACNTFQQ